MMVNIHKSINFIGKNKKPLVLSKELFMVGVPGFEPGTPTTPR